MLCSRSCSLLVLLCLFACDSGQLSRLVLEIRDIPTQTFALRVELGYADGSPLAATFGPESPIVAELPKGSGLLQIKVMALSEAGCSIGQAELSADPPLNPVYQLNLTPSQDGACVGPASCPPQTLCLLSTKAPPTSAVWGSPLNLWGVGPGGTVNYFDGTWHPYDSGVSQDLISVWGSGEADVWAVGKLGTITRWGGAGWFAQSSGFTKTFRSVSGGRAFDIWVCGDAPTAGGVGTVLHFDGTTWKTANSNTGGSLFGIVARDGSAWAVGEQGQLLSGPATGLKPLASPTVATLRAVGISSTALFFAGDDGQLYRLIGNTASPLPMAVNPVKGLAVTPNGSLAVVDGSPSLALFSPPYDRAMVLSAPAPILHVEAAQDGNILLGGAGWLAYVRTN